MTDWEKEFEKWSETQPEKYPDAHIVFKAAWDIQQNKIDILRFETEHEKMIYWNSMQEVVNNKTKVLVEALEITNNAIHNCYKLNRLDSCLDAAQRRNEKALEKYRGGK